MIPRLQPAQDLARRRRAIAIGLDTQLEPLQCERALALWDSAYASSRATAIIDYVIDLAVQLDLPPRKRHELRMALYQSLLRNDVGAATVAASLAAATTNPVAQVASPAYVVFLAVCARLLDGVRADQSGAYEDFKLLMRTVGLPKTLDRQELLAWVGGEGGLDALRRSSSGLLSEILHALYVAAAGALGPVAADQLLVAAINGAEKLPEARAFAPRQLL